MLISQQKKLRLLEANMPKFRKKANKIFRI